MRMPQSAVHHALADADGGRVRIDLRSLGDVSPHTRNFILEHHIVGFYRKDPCADIRSCPKKNARK